MICRIGGFLIVDRKDDEKSQNCRVAVREGLSCCNVTLTARTNLVSSSVNLNWQSYMYDMAVDL